MSTQDPAYVALREENERLREVVARIANFGCQRGGLDYAVCDIEHPRNDEEWCAPCIAFVAHQGQPRSHGLTRADLEGWE